MPTGLLLYTPCTQYSTYNRPTFFMWLQKYDPHLRNALNHNNKPKYPNPRAHTHRNKHSFNSPKRTGPNRPIYIYVDGLIKSRRGIFPLSVLQS